MSQSLKYIHIHIFIDIDINYIIGTIRNMQSPVVAWKCYHFCMLKKYFEYHKAQFFPSLRYVTCHFLRYLLSYTIRIVQSLNLLLHENGRSSKVYVLNNSVITIVP